MSVDTIDKKVDELIAAQIKFMLNLADAFGKDADRMRYIVGLMGGDTETAILKLLELAREYEVASVLLVKEASPPE